MEDYKPNSHKYREESKTKSQEERQIQKVVKGSVRTKKKSELTKLADIFISEDVKNVKNFWLMDIIVPTVKKAILSTVDMVLNGDSGKYSKNNSTSKVSYRKYYEDQAPERKYSDGPKTRSRFDFEDIVFESRGEAEAVREQMIDVIDRYGFVTVADMYDMADLTGPYTGNKYGWTNIRNAETVRITGGGYILKLPKAMPID